MRRLLWNQVSFALSGLVIQVLLSYCYHGADAYELGKLSGARDFVKPLLKDIENSDLFGTQFSSSYKKFGEGFLKTLTDNTDDLLNSFGKLDDQVGDTISGVGRFIDISENELNINAPNFEVKIKRDEIVGSKAKSVAGDSAIRESETVGNEMNINDAPTSEELFTDLDNKDELQKEVEPNDSPNNADAKKANQSLSDDSSALSRTDASNSKQASSSTGEQNRKQLSSKGAEVEGEKTSSKIDDNEKRGAGLFSILNNLKLMLSVPIKIVSTGHMRPREKNAPCHEKKVCCDCEPFT